MRFIITLIILSIILTAGCGTDAGTEQETCSEGATCSAVLDAGSEGTPTSDVKVDKLEIYHFHTTSQCYSCKTVGDYAQETVNTYFAEELESGRIVFAHVNGDLIENKGLIIKYGATGSSLWLGTYKGDLFEAEENTNVWYKINDKQGYMDYLKGVIEEKLEGK